MERIEPNISKVNGGLRNSCEDFFKTITRYEHKKLSTPFLFFLNGEVEAIYYTRELFQKAKDNDTILKAWAGEWSTDIFHFKVSELKEYVEKTKTRII